MGVPGQVGGLANLDPIVYVYSVLPSLRLLDVNDNGGDGVDAVVEVPLKPGDYYVVVEDLDGGSGECKVEIRMIADWEQLMTERRLEFN